MTRSRGDLALVLSGGGARGAYQVGVLCALARARPTLEFDVLTGVSAGAINAAFLASHPGPLGERVAALRRLWLGIDVDSVIEVADRWFLQNVLRVGLQLVSGGHISPPKSRGLVSTTPLGELLSEHLEPDSLGVIPGIERNLRSGRHKAVAITGSCFSTGRSVTWVAGRPLDLWERPNRRAEATSIRLEHVMASAALPLLFPAVEVDGQWYGDGGVRLTAPLAPAIHLGASRLLTVSTRFAGRANDPERESGSAYPPPAQVAGVLLNAIFLDLIDADALHLERINRLLSESPNGAHGGLRPVALEVLRPSEDLGAIANAFEARMPRGLRFLTRGLGTRRTRTNDLLSLLMFQHDYVGRLIELGERDGAARLDQMLALVDE